MLHTVRRVVTGHDRDGRSVVKTDGLVEPENQRLNLVYPYRVWTTNVSPADNDDEFDGARRETGLTCPGGTVLRFVQLAPGAHSPLHRTSSLDYGIVLEGEVDMELDDGSLTHLKPGDVVVQRGTMHAWVNNSESWAQIAFVLIDAKPATVNGKPAEPTQLPHLQRPQ